MNVRIPFENGVLEGELVVPPWASGVVLFAHGSGSSRLSPRNLFVAGELQKAGFATLLMDLLDEDEANERTKVFDIQLLAKRLYLGMNWLAENEDTGHLPLGLFGASTGAAAALKLAARPPEKVCAIVSRGGRPDLAWESLPWVEAPTLLIVGGEDHDVLGLNRAAQERLHCPNELHVVPHAAHLFSEPGALEEVAILATEWFRCHLTPGCAEAMHEAAHVSQS